MNIILTCLGNFQEYILINIHQLAQLGHLPDRVFVVTHKIFASHFEKCQSQITLLFVEDLQPVDGCDLISQFQHGSTLDRNFRNGFWFLASHRFFVLHQVMKQHHITDVIHLENDVLIYYHVDTLTPHLNKECIYIPFDSLQRNIASIVYIPTHDIWQSILEQYNVNLNDMNNFRNIQVHFQEKHARDLVQHFPIFCEPWHPDPAIRFVSTNFDTFHMVFDAAAMGQYLGGVDPRNDARNTVGFVNETCVVKYNQYRFCWETSSDGGKRPFLVLSPERQIPIFNLHIHSKDLFRFI